MGFRDGQARLVRPDQHVFASFGRRELLALLKRKEQDWHKHFIDFVPECQV